MKPEKIVQRLFEKGYYPNDLPPEFNVIGINPEFVINFISNLENFKESKIYTEQITLNFPKNYSGRRWFHLLNPISFIKLSNTIAENWFDISMFCHQSEFSTSKIILSEEENFLFENEPFKESIRERITRSAGKKHVLIMDIASFYPSIYTHCLEWILEGRRLTREERKDRSFLGVALDMDIRNTQSQKTNGIPIGPETSRIISEIIGTYLDKKITDLNIDVKGTRYVDDYHLYFNNLSDLEIVKNKIQSELSKLHLSSNEAKCEVKNVPEVFAKPWVRIINQTVLRDSGFGLQEDLISLFSLAIHNSQSNQKDNSLKFLVSFLINKKLNLNDDTKKLLVELIRHSIEQTPLIMSHAFKLLNKNNCLTDSTHFKNIFNEKLLVDSLLGKTYEILWILNGYNKFKIQVPNEVVVNAVEQSEVLVLTYLLYMSENSLIADNEIELIKKHVEDCISGEKSPFTTQYWLIIYEAVKRNWFDIKVERPSFVQFLLDSNIDFINDGEIDWEDVDTSEYPLMDFADLEIGGPF